MDKMKKQTPPAQPKQPGMLMWEDGIQYFSDPFTSDSTKPVSYTHLTLPTTGAV